MRLRGIVIGARRKRQGIGGFLARCLERTGLEVVGVVGTSLENARIAQQELLAEDLAVRPYDSLQRALEVERPDFVAICSPIEFHRVQIEEVAAAGCHCLCEKPLWWESRKLAPQERAETTRALAESFRRRSRHLALVTQWPCTLPTFRALHPRATIPPQRFRMHLSPSRSGEAMVLDALSHPISMWWDLCGPGTLREVRARSLDGTDRSLLLEATLEHAKGSTTLEINLQTCERAPRPAGYTLDEYHVERTLELPEYRQFLVSGDRRTVLPDPLQDLAAEFAHALRSGRPTNVAEIVQSVVHLEQFVAAASQRTGGSGGAGGTSNGQPA